MRTLPMPGAVVAELAPENIESYLRDHPPPPPPLPGAVKLYRRSESGLEYHEAWPTGDGEVVEHWGVSGERGDTRRHATPSPSDQRRALERIKSSARAAGFRTLPRSRHVGLLVSRAIDGFGSPDDLEERHALEDYLDQLTGWLGLGHCDGGSTGSGSMEAYCLVADYAIAAAAIARELRESRFSAFSVAPAT